MLPKPARVAPQVGPAPLGEDWFAPRSAGSGFYAAPVAPRRGLTFTLVSVALVGFTLGGCLFLWKSESLPRWTGTAPSEVATTTITNAPLTTVAMPVVAEDPKNTAVALLPSAPPAAQAAITSMPVTRAPAVVKAAPAAARAAPAPATELRVVDPSETPASTESPAAGSPSTMAPTVDPDPTPAQP